MVRTPSRVAWLAVWSSLAMLSLVSLEASRQAGTSRGNRQTPNEDEIGRLVSVTGCVDDGGEAGHYMLTSATVIAGTATSGTEARAKSGTLGNTYSLMGGDLQTHVGHKVEVTGVMDATMKKGSKDRTARNRNNKSADENVAAATARAMNGTLTVKSVKMLATACP
jgi:hypothetical protein